MSLADSCISSFVRLMAAAFLVACLIVPAAAQQIRNSSYDRLPILITQPIDESKLVTLRGNTRPEAN